MRPDSEDVLGFAENRSPDARLSEGEVDARELEAGLDREPRQPMVEERP